MGVSEHYRQALLAIARVPHSGDGDSEACARERGHLARVALTSAPATDRGAVDDLPTLTIKLCSDCGEPECPGEGDSLVDVRVVREDDLRDHPKGAVEPLMVERLSRARGLLEALATCSDDAPIEGVREIATEVAALIDPSEVERLRESRDAMTDGFVRKSNEVERLRAEVAEWQDWVLGVAMVASTVKSARKGVERAVVGYVRHATTLRQIKSVAAIEAPPVSDEVPAKVWKLAHDALALDQDRPRPPRAGGACP